MLPATLVRSHTRNQATLLYRDGAEKRY